MGRWIAEALALNQQPTEARVRGADGASGPIRPSAMTPRRKRSVSPRRSTATNFGFMAFIGRPRSLSPTGRLTQRWARRCSRSRDPPTIPTTGAGSRGTRRSRTPLADGSRRPAPTRAGHDEIVAGLTPHLAIHGFGLRTMIDEVAGRWDASAASGRLEAAVGANAAPAATWMPGRCWPAPSPPISPATPPRPSVSRRSPIRRCCRAPAA